MASAMDMTKTCSVTCGGHTHRIVRIRGAIVLLDHDVDAERVRKALAPDAKPPKCIALLEQWRLELSSRQTRQGIPEWMAIWRKAAMNIQAERSKLRGDGGVPRKTLQERILAKVQDAFPRLYNHYRCSQTRCAGWNSTQDVGLCKWRLEEPGATCNADRVWSKNREWSGTNTNFVVRLDLGKYLCVMRDGLQVIDGLVTLSASRVHGEPGDVWEAVWVEQGVGFALRNVYGLIVRRNGVCAHGKTMRGAMAALARRMKA